MFSEETGECHSFNILNQVSPSPPEWEVCGLSGDLYRSIHYKVLLHQQAHVLSVSGLTEKIIILMLECAVVAAPRTYRRLICLAPLFSSTTIKATQAEREQRELEDRRVTIPDRDELLFTSVKPSTHRRQEKVLCTIQNLRLLYRFLHEHEGSTAESSPRRKGWMNSGTEPVL